MPATLPAPFIKHGGTTAVNCSSQTEPFTHIFSDICTPLYKGHNRLTRPPLTLPFMILKL